MPELTGEALAAADFGGEQALRPIAAISHAVFETPDLERQIAYYRDIMGLNLVARDAKQAYFSARSGDVCIVLESGTAARCARLALKCAQDVDLKDISRHLGSHGIVTQEKSDPQPLSGHALAFEGPEGIAVEIVRVADRSGVGSGAGLQPGKLGHIAFNVTDVQKGVEFFNSVLGFRTSDWMGDFFAFLRCGPDHHTINLLKGGRTKMHHLAFEARDFEHIKDACDFLGRHEIPLIWGPGRHKVGHNLYIYHHNPDGQIVELYAELDIMTNEEAGYFDPRPWHEDNPQRPKVSMPGPFVSNSWGIATPQSFRE
jgi:catechol 2,3-dioxygenase-like lactoylglutathione lyase family enzyme